MRDLNRNWIVATCLVLAAVASIYFLHHKRTIKYVFINETSDHRFDESIRMSIFAAEKRTGVQNAVFISDAHLEKESIESVTARLFRELELGRNNGGRAILYFYSPENKALKIEVGYALEGIVPDVTVKGLELAAKSFVFSNRYQDFWAELINTLNIEIDEKEHNADLTSAGFDFHNFKFLSGGAGTSSHDYTLTWDQFKKEFSEAREKDLEHFKAQRTVEASLQLYLESLGAGIGSSNLNLLTLESRYFREQVPQTSFQLYRNWRMYQKAQVDKIFISKNLAFVFFQKDHPVLPIVLRQEDNLWKIHEPLSWSLFQRFEDSSKVFQKYSIKFLPQDLDWYLKNILGQPLYPLQDPLTISFIAETETDFSSIKSILIHVYGIDRVAKLLENENLNKLSEDQLKMAADTYTNLGQITNFLKTYRTLAALHPENPTIKENLKFFEKNLNFNNSEWRLTY